ncbi:Beta-1:3-galactosyltransferase brn-like protein [Dinothrombium tinctorium]|uniref:Hexosyltransferase n=1 Tax=Dinothrombium tinctorium TaxID=1965070 RepID=A0A3S3QIU6_9ACAR|nr:Beta-1:3-galactosyltransferase brn-like protein [Dinothrombium tinctorium]
MKRRMLKIVLLCSLLVGILFQYLGLFDNLFVIEFEANFDSSLNRNILNLVEDHKRGVRNENSSGIINSYNYRFIIENKHKCKNKSGESYEHVRVLIMIKSAIKHIESRDGIRSTWGSEGKFSDGLIKRVFVLGSCDGVQFEDLKGKEITCENVIKNESMTNNDIVQIDFIDNYYNNTIKMMSAQKWAVKFCPKADFILFVDDDYYVSMKNLLKFLRNPFTYDDDPNYFSENFVIPKPLPSNFDGRLYAGHVYVNEPPIRSKMSKWRISLQEYPYSLFPPFVLAGTLILSNSALIDIYYASFYVKHFRFDDVYIAMLARSVKIKPLHSTHIFTEKQTYSREKYSTLIASHGFKNVNELLKVWRIQKRLGFA